MRSREFIATHPATLQTSTARFLLAPSPHILLNQTRLFVLNTVDGCIPVDIAVGTTQEIEEERRLLYVAMTRAKDQLHLMVPQRFFVHQQRGSGDRHVCAQRTRFIPPSILKQFNQTAWPPPRATTSDSATTLPAPVELILVKPCGG
jgi:DNA helicase-2/ATP-dependent DNA helicase PcrA